MQLTSYLINIQLETSKYITTQTTTHTNFFLLYNYYLKNHVNRI
jgi:hypothetical protein